MKKRMISILLVVMMVIGVFAGCGRRKTVTVETMVRKLL